MQIYPYHRRPGDRIVRVPLTKPEYVRLKPMKAPGRLPPPQLILVVGFAVLILFGSLLLLLPIASVPGQDTTMLTALFTATSAICVTGLVVVDTGTHWSPFGQAVILVLIQVGGLGFMTASTVLFLVVGHRISLRQRMLMREALGQVGMGDIVRLARQIALTTLGIEAIGVALFFARFVRDMPPAAALWHALFHSVSAFNNAGFDIVGGFRSLTPFRSDPFIVLTTAVLIVLGGISFTVMADIVRVRSWRRLMLDSKLVLVATLILLSTGTLVIILLEGSNRGTIGGMNFPQQVLDAFFLSVTARTAGFNTVDTGLLSEQALLFLMALMFIGAASGSTGGGIKVNTVSVLGLAIVSTIRGRVTPSAFGRELLDGQILRALTVALLALLLVFIAALVLTTSEPMPFLVLAFEATSAFGTVGLSTGITPNLSALGKFSLIPVMFVGRLGPLTLALALTLRQTPVHYRYPIEIVKIG